MRKHCAANPLIEMPVAQRLQHHLLCQIQKKENALSYIYNVDETGLFYELLPTRALDVKGQPCSGGKHSKKCGALLPCTNMDGSRLSALPHAISLWNSLLKTVHAEAERALFQNKQEKCYVN